MRDNGELYSEERPKKERQVLQWKKENRWNIRSFFVGIFSGKCYTYLKVNFTYL